MRLSVFAVFAAVGATALAQSLSGLPQCAQTCVGNGLASTGCNAIDIGCICASKAWISQLSCCIAKSCSAADQQATIQFADQLCSTNGVTTLPTSAACTATAGGSAASSAPPASGGSSSAMTAAGMNMTTSATATSAGGSTAPSSGSNASGSGSGSASISATAASSSSAAGAENKQVGFGMALAGLIAAVL